VKPGCITTGSTITIQVFDEFGSRLDHVGEGIEKLPVHAKPYGMDPLEGN
jgi:hypothetical protein